ncbi:AMIN domain-containing protein [Chlorogloeopsis sp. ULAP01]|uniref:AMIN domain-containing protein n=1 Tax=Chlorogloeopsis sp. ULAP01 TaxID=3056483 RepID=UPI0025AA98DD|nr:AMIN domain-containing protein [Chlorogloeopsis sp. ULAP01]MDM9385755.1 AMIN domain-containing protein [Chlorogloeopsis sp. ULAP01]
MRNLQFINSWWLASIVFVLLTPAVLAGEAKNSSVFNSDIRQLRELKLPLTKVTHLLSQQTTQTEIIKVTGVKLNSTDTGFDVILKTTEGAKLEVNTNSKGNTYVADIPNTQLQGNAFRQAKPVEGITEVTVTNQDDNSIRVMVLGSVGAPKIELFDSDKGLIFGVTPLVLPVQPQQPKPLSTLQHSSYQVLKQGESSEILSFAERLTVDDAFERISLGDGASVLS